MEKDDLHHASASGSASPVTGSDFDDPVEARRVVRKVDWRLIPLLTFLYTLTFLDRVNIGNARLWNLEKDLRMSGYDYNLAVLVFYIPYILLEIPSNMLLNRIRPRYYISALITGWGLTVTFAGFCHNFAGLIVARIFIGIFEAGMFPGCLFLISSWYRRHELLSRMAWFMVANDIAGSISGLLGAGLGSLDGTGGYSGWSWIFWIEGLMTVIAAVLAFFFIPDFPHESTFLTPSEKTWLLRRLDADSKAGGRNERMTPRGVLRALRDWKVLAAGSLYLAVCVTAYSISVFTPTILRAFGWGSLKSNLLSTPIRIASAIVSVAVGILSDKTRMRGVYCLAGFAMSIAGLLVTMLLKGGNMRYMGLYFAAMGIYICQPLVVAWCVNQVVGNIKRGTLTAFAISCGQLGGIISAVVFPEKDSPQYVPGISTCIAFQVVGIITAVGMMAACRWENRQRDLGKRDDRRDLPEEQVRMLGERHPDFRYTL
ncbi:MFS transporter [Plectosphaerella cucumerina]|uniref:MFS transporter n=1 Tax=Plectosphaerella cucumerina TaxID=40658 RepID=A0A8K0X9D9_9PEZI|nr:MFS transporter [Plectosphaerella cucumerina]